MFQFSAEPLRSETIKKIHKQLKFQNNMKIGTSGMSSKLTKDSRKSTVNRALTINTFSTMDAARIEELDQRRQRQQMIKDKANQLINNKYFMT